MNVTVEHRGKKRKGRGFSIPEVVEAGLTWVQCAQLKLRVDRNRKSSYKENVALLKDAAKNVPRQKKKGKTKAQRAAKKNVPKKAAPEQKNE